MLEEDLTFRVRHADVFDQMLTCQTLQIRFQVCENVCRVMCVYNNEHAYNKKIDQV